MARTETVTVVFTALVGSIEWASRLGYDAYDEHLAAVCGAVMAHHGMAGEIVCFARLEQRLGTEA